MEQTKCLNNNTWEKREHKIILGHNNHDNNLPTTKIMKRFNQQSSISSSWEDYQEEEEAFSDSTAILSDQGGSLIWPPRSYSCSFCKREFRSAQALGGHMNVHRRDRALLKQVAINNNSHDNDDLDHTNNNNHDHHFINPCSKSKPSDQNPSQVCSPNTNNNNVVAHTHHSVSRVSTNSVLSIGISKVITTINEGIDQDDQPKMSMGSLDLAMGAYLKDEDNYHQEEFSKYNKRFKKSNDDYYNNNVALFQFLDDEIKCSNVKDDDGLKVQEVLNVRASKSIEELDLELRLGKPHQKIK